MDVQKYDNTNNRSILPNNGCRVEILHGVVRKLIAKHVRLLMFLNKNVLTIYSR